MTKTAKQVIVMRKDLNMRKGKMVAQGCHASLGSVLLIQEDRATANDGEFDKYSEDVHTAAQTWLNSTFTKICVGVNSEEELMGIYADATWDGLPCKLITDNGLTEFNGVPTKTCLAIGPAWSDDIDKITGHLKLL